VAEIAANRVMIGCVKILRIVFYALAVTTAFGAQERSGADQAVSRFMYKYHVPGLAYVILRDGNVVDHGTFGFANVTTKERITNTSVFPIASLSKPFVALAVLSLAQKNLLDIHDPVGKYLDFLPDDWKAIPLLRLLDHTSGVPDHYNAGKWNVLGPAPVSSDELIRKLITLPLNFKPGEKFQYSNGNYALLANVIEKVSGQPNGAYLDERIFRPLGMKHTKVLTQADLPNIVAGYETVDRGIKSVYWNPDWCYGNGAIGTTWSDLARLDAGLYTERVVKFSTLSFITTPQKLLDGTKPNYAMGWFLGHSRNAETIDHDGKIIGWRSYFIRYPKYQLTVIIISNNGTPGLRTLGADLAGTVVDDLALDPMTDLAPDLTQTHFRFVQAIMDAKVDESWLTTNLKKDYESKGHWDSLSKTLKSCGQITLFEPAVRTQTGPGQTTTRYRLEQGDDVHSITIGSDSQGMITSLWVTS